MRLVETGVDIGSVVCFVAVQLGEEGWEEGDFSGDEVVVDGVVEVRGVRGGDCEGHALGTKEEDVGFGMKFVARRTKACIGCRRAVG